MPPSPMGAPIISKSQWEQIKLAAVAGAPNKAILQAFPGLTKDALLKASQRGAWPTPERIARESAKRDAEQQHPSSPLSTTSPPLGGQPQIPGISALNLTMEATKMVRNATLAGWSGRACAAVDRWAVPTPTDMSEGLALVRTLARLDGHSASGGTQVNVQVNVGGPWARKSEEPAWIDDEE